MILKGVKYGRKLPARTLSFSDSVMYWEVIYPHILFFFFCISSNINVELILAHVHRETKVHYAKDSKLRWKIFHREMEKCWSEIEEKGLGFRFTWARINKYPRFISSWSILHSCHKCWMIASTAPLLHRRGRLIKQMLLEMKFLATSSCFFPCCSEGNRKKRHWTCEPDTGNGGYYGYLFWVANTCRSPPREMDDQSPDLWAERLLRGLFPDL